VPGAYSINLQPKASSPREVAFASATEPESLPIPTTGPQDWDKGEFWPVKGRDVPKIMEAINALSHMEGTAQVRLQDQEVCATWELKNALKNLSEDRGSNISGHQIVPRRVMLDSPWVKFGEFSKVSWRVYPHGDATAQPGNCTVFIWMAHPPGLSFTFNLRIGDSMSTAPRLWQATMIHYRMDLRWSQVCQALEAVDKKNGSLRFVLQVLQWHGPEDNPADDRVEAHTNVSLALEMLQGAKQVLEQHAAQGATRERRGSFRGSGGSTPVPPIASPQGRSTPVPPASPRQSQFLHTWA
jgi:hypothetical protein